MSAVDANQTEKNKKKTNDEVTEINEQNKEIPNRNNERKLRGKQMNENIWRNI